MSSQAGIGLSPAEAQSQVPAEAAADDAREPIRDRRDLVEGLDERDHEVLDEVQHGSADRVPVVHDPGRPRGGARDGDVLVVEALRVAAVRQVDRNDRELRATREAGQVDQRDDRERLLGARDVAVEEEDHVVAGGNMRRRAPAGARGACARSAQEWARAVRRSGTGSASVSSGVLPLAGTVTGSSYCSRRGPGTLTGRCGMSSSPETPIQPRAARVALRSATGPRIAQAVLNARSSAVLTAASDCARASRLPAGRAARRPWSAAAQRCTATCRSRRGSRPPPAGARAAASGPGARGGSSSCVRSPRDRRERCRAPRPTRRTRRPTGRGSRRGPASARHRAGSRSAALRYWNPRSVPAAR